MVDNHSGHGNAQSARASPRSPRGGQGIIGSLLAEKNKSNNNNTNNNSNNGANESQGGGDHSGQRGRGVPYPNSNLAQKELDREDLTDRDFYNPRSMSTPRADTSRLPSLPLQTPLNGNNNNNNINNYNNNNHSYDNNTNNMNTSMNMNNSNMSVGGNTINRSIHNAIVNNGGHSNRPNGVRGNGTVPRGHSQSPSGELRATIGEKVIFLQYTMTIFLTSTIPPTTTISSFYSLNLCYLYSFLSAPTFSLLPFFHSLDIRKTNIRAFRIFGP